MNWYSGFYQKNLLEYFISASSEKCILAILKDWILQIIAFTMYHFTNTWICWHLIGFKPLHQVKPHRKLACVSYHLSYMSNNLYDLGGGILFQRKSKDLFTLFNISFNKNKLRFSSSTSNFVIKVCFLNCFQYNTDFSPMRWENKSRLMRIRNMKFHLTYQHLVYTRSIDYEYEIFPNLDTLNGNSKRLCCKSTGKTKVSCVNF